MLRGWFDAFRSEGGPTLYSLPNRTPVTEDVRNVIIYVSFATIFIAFLIVFPGIRKEKFSTFISVTISLFVGAVILTTGSNFLLLPIAAIILPNLATFFSTFLAPISGQVILISVTYFIYTFSLHNFPDAVSNYGTEWHVARATVSSPYRAFSREKISADVGVKVGLNSVNITLRAAAIHKRSEDINYNERFRWIGATEMKQEYRAALVKGLPFPLLTIAEYFTQELEGFCWGRRYRLAGYYSHILLWSAFALWLLMNVLLCTVPRYGAYTMQLTGALMLLANAVYAHLLPRRPLVIPFEGAALHFRFGWCFWLLLAAGVTAIVVGGAVAIVDLLFPNKFSTILEVDYGMPYRCLVSPEKRQCSQTSSLPSSDGGSEGGCFENGAYEGDDGYATVIDGKRAVSLRNFGKFAQREKLAFHSGHKNIHAFTTSAYHPSSSKDVNIDISAAALW